MLLFWCVFYVEKLPFGDFFCFTPKLTERRNKPSRLFVCRIRQIENPEFFDMRLTSAKMSLLFKSSSLPCQWIHPPEFQLHQAHCDTDCGRMSLVPWPTASAQTTATRCCHDGKPSTAKMPVRNINNAFVTAFLLIQTRAVATRAFCQSFSMSFWWLTYLLPSQSKNKLAWAVLTINCNRGKMFFDWPKQPENQQKTMSNLFSRC